MSSIKSYPFTTKSQIRSRLSTDPTFVLQCLGVLYNMQTETEQATRSTRVRNRSGFMSSHAVRGSALAVRAVDGALTIEETEQAASLVGHYTRQLAAHFRAKAIAANPDLAEAARVFSAG